MFMVAVILMSCLKQTVLPVAAVHRATSRMKMYACQILFSLIFPKFRFQDKFAFP